MGTIEILTTRAALRHRERALRAQGSPVVDGFSLNGSTAGPAHGITCVGVVDSAGAARDALLAAMAGASLVALIDADAPTTIAFLDEIERLGRDLRITGDGPPQQPGELTPEDRTLLGLLAAGLGVRDASAGAGMSLRTAHRHLANLRARFGASTTAELLGSVAAASNETDPSGSSVDGLVGRDQELATCTALLGAGRPVLLTGPAGIGKTAILRAVARADGRRVLGGRALPTFRWSPFFPLTQAVGPFPSDADTTAVVDLVARRAAGSLLVLDDLHWSDTATLAVLDAIALCQPLLVACRDAGDRSVEVAARLTRSGASRVELAPLEDSAADLLLRRHRPKLTPDVRHRLVDRSGGNPLHLLESTAGPDPTLRARVSTAMAQLSSASRDALVRLALLGRPAGADLLGDGVAPLIEWDLVRTDGDAVELRHDLIGQEVLRTSPPEDQQRHRVDLATRLPAAEAARHHAAVGDVAAARGAALRAAHDAASPFERARHLGFAAQCVAPDDDVDDSAEQVLILLHAVDAFLESGELDEARSTMELLPAGSATPEVQLRRARLEWRQGHPETARAAVEAGLAGASGTSTPVEVALRVEQLRFPIRVDFDARRAVALANDAVDLATRLGCDEAQAFTLLGSALLIDGSPEWSAAIERGRTIAQRTGDVDAELEAANALTAAHLLSGDRRIARMVATESLRSARSAHRGHWEQQFGVLANLLGMIDGDLLEVADWGRTEVGPHLSAGAQTAYGAYAVALADLGRQHAALATVREGMSLAKGDETGTSFLCWAEAEARWLLGQPGRALAAAERSLSCAVAGFPVRPLAGAARAWCQYDAGLPVTEAEEAGWDFARAARVESRGVALLAAGDHAGAAERLTEAAQLAEDAPRFSLRARWGVGEVWRHAGEPERAMAVLLDVHDTAERRGFMALHGRCHRSLRQLGWSHESPALGSDCPLTPRQCEVLDLVGRGHTTQETASILGVGPSTVETHVCDAMARLGATTRAQAALLAAPWLTPHDQRDRAHT